jgi:hypothetical protein
MRKIRDPGLFVFCKRCDTLFLDVAGEKFGHVCGVTVGQVVEDPATGTKYLATKSPALRWHKTRLYKRVVADPPDSHWSQAQSLQTQWIMGGGGRLSQ